MSDIEKYKAAVEAIENEDLKPESPEYAIACIVRAWLDYIRTRRPSAYWVKGGASRGAINTHGSRQRRYTG